MATSDVVRRARIVWAAMLAAVVLYGVVLRIVVPHGQPLEGPLPRLLQGLAIVTGAFALLVFRFSFPSVAGRPSLGPEQAMARYVMSWALAESVALYGLIVSFLERDAAAAVPFLAAAIVLLVVLRPRPQHLTST